MTALRRRMTEDLPLRGYAEPTIKAYVLPVSRLARFYGIAPDQIAEAHRTGRRWTTSSAAAPPPSAARSTSAVYQCDACGVRDYA